MKMIVISLDIRELEIDIDPEENKEDLDFLSNL